MQEEHDHFHNDSAPVEPAADIELDGLRIRKVARARQAEMRFSSYCFVGAAACAVCGIDLGWRAIRRVAADGHGLRPALYLLAAGLLGWMARKLLAKSRQLSREARLKQLPEPTTPPDFSTLSHGSHIAGNLEKIE
jgi:hypothetical protein